MTRIVEGDSTDRIHPVVWILIGSGFASILALCVGIWFGPSRDNTEINRGLASQSALSTPTQSPPSLEIGMEDDTVDQGSDQDFDRFSKIVTPAANAHTVAIDNGSSSKSAEGVGPVHPKIQRLTSEEIDKATQPAVVTLRATTSQGGKAGSGFVIDDLGVIATNYHVIRGANQMTAAFSDGSESAIDGFLAFDPEHDLALVHTKTTPKGLRPLHLADSLPDKGAEVFVFGAPIGLSGTMSRGNVSAIRSGAEIARIPEASQFYSGAKYANAMSWIQISAPISHGNSGGPVILENGDVVGVSTWTLPQGQNLNFAVPATYLSVLFQVRSKKTRDLAELPAQKDVIASLQPTKEDNDSKILRFVSLQHELDRLSLRLLSINQDSSSIEHDGATLQRNRDAAEANGWKTEALYEKSIAELNSLAYAIRRAGGIPSNVSDFVNLQNYASNLKTSGAQLLFLVQKLQTQINYLAELKSSKVQERLQVESQMQSLRSDVQTALQP
ncbi:MAG TPA: serine protease [Pirellulales bacterium]|jgi:S1-C subfamily serine protease|nr:serine protease [Pirellulales bacterium]